MNFFSKLVTRLTSRKSVEGVSRGRRKTFDSAFTFRMGAGFPGDVNRTHPANIEVALNDVTNPVQGYGLAVIVNPTGNSVRNVLDADNGATDIYGVSVRPYPFQEATSGPYGAQGYDSATSLSVPPTLQPLDVLKSGYIIVQLYGTTPVSKGSSVFISTAATGGGLQQGGFVGATIASHIIALSTRSYFNGPADPNGIVELALHVG